MLPDLDETLKLLLIQKGGLAPSVVDIRFDAPARHQVADHPAINLYLYDVRENVEQREVYWDTTKDGDQRVRITRRPLRVDVSYLVTCFAATVEDEHRLLWQVLETFFRNSPLPDDLLQGNMQHLLHPAQTKIAQPDGLLKYPVDLWGVMQSQLPPAINLTVTLELDLNDVRSVPLVFTRALKIGERHISRDADGHDVLAEQLEPGWEAAPAQLGGVVHSTAGQPLAGVAVRLLAKTGNGHPVQFGASKVTDESGHYRFQNVPLGDYNLVVEVPGQTPVQRPLSIAVGARGEILPDLVYEVEVPAPKS